MVNVIFHMVSGEIVERMLPEDVSSQVPNTLKSDQVISFNTEILGLTHTYHIPTSNIAFIEVVPM